MRVFNNNLQEKLLIEPCLVEVTNISNPVLLESGLMWLSVLFEEIDTHSNLKMNLTFQPIENELYFGKESKAYSLIAPLLDLEHVEGLSITFEELNNILFRSVFWMRLKKNRNSYYPSEVSICLER